VVNFTRTVAGELFQQNIRINCVCSGPINTPFRKPGTQAPSDRPNWPPVGLPEDVAEAAMFLASDASRFITGTNLVVDGGLTAQGPNRTGPTAI
jgi:NAD(P)-dependent dehydrogenase (short-subunit alcohol dehydrogenase family)